jgi:hypothetical protein
LVGQGRRWAVGGNPWVVTGCNRRCYIGFRRFYLCVRGSRLAFGNHGQRLWVWYGAGRIAKLGIDLGPYIAQVLTRRSDIALDGVDLTGQFLHGFLQFCLSHIGRAAQICQAFAQRTRYLWQLIRPDKEQQHHDNQDQFCAANAKHGCLLWLGP